MRKVLNLKVPHSLAGLLCRLDEARHPADKPLDLGSGITLSIKGGCYVIPTPRVPL
jgi:hypothetical protein